MDAIRKDSVAIAALELCEKFAKETTQESDPRVALEYLTGSQGLVDAFESIHVAFGKTSHFVSIYGARVKEASSTCLTRGVKGGAKKLVADVRTRPV